MKRVWEWLGANSKALGGLAAVTVIITAVVTGTPYLVRQLGPDIVVRTNLDRMDLPAELAAWLREMSRVANLRDLSQIRALDEELAGSLSNPIIQNLYRNVPEDRLQLEIENQSDGVVSGLFLRLDGVYGLFDVRVNGTFLREAQAEQLSTAITGGYRDKTLVLPELPPLPPESTLQVTLYGTLIGNQPIVSSAIHSYEIKEIIEVEDNIFLFPYNNPYFFAYILAVLLLFSWLVLSQISQFRRSRLRSEIIQNETKNILYDQACHAALDERADDALALLREAVSAGYANTKHALTDSDLVSLHDREEFKAIFAVDATQSSRTGNQDSV